METKFEKSDITDSLMQIDGVLAKVSKGIGFFRHIRKLVPKYKLINTYNILILPHFDSLVWDNCSDNLLDKVQKMQTRAASIVIGQPYEIRSNNLLKELNWQSFKERIYQKKYIHVQS